MDEYEMFRDCLRQIAVFDPEPALVEAAVACHAEMSPERQFKVVRLADGSEYGPRLLGLYGAIIVLEAA
jgi:hypothetical protein